MIIKINLRIVVLLVQFGNVCVRNISKYVLKLRNCGYGFKFIEVTDHARCFMLCKLHVFKHAYAIQYVFSLRSVCGPRTIN